MIAPLSAEQESAFRREGHVLLRGVLDRATIEALQQEADLAVAWEDERMRAQAPHVDALNRRGERYFVTRRSETRPVLRDLVLGPLGTGLCRALLGRDAYLFIDTFIAKQPGCPVGFGWHQDYGYLAHYGYAHYPPNLSVWAPLDDVDEANGALRILPFSRFPARALVPHHTEAGTFDRVADFGADAGDLVPMRAGDLLVFSGLLPHASGPNTTDRTRRAYQWQYSPAPVLDGGRPIMLAEPVLVAGEAVR